MRPDGGRRQEAEPLTGPVVVERLHQFAGEMFGPAIVGREVGGGGKVELSRDLEWNIAETLGDGPDRLRRREAIAERLGDVSRSEDHTSELQSLAYLVCRLLLEK